MNSKFPEWVADKIEKNPYYWRMAKADAIGRVNDFFENFSDDHKTKLLLDKLERARKEYPDPNYTRAEITDNITEEVLDITGWTEAGVYSAEKTNNQISQD